MSKRLHAPVPFQKILPHITRGAGPRLLVTMGACALLLIGGGSYLLSHATPAPVVPKAPAAQAAATPAAGEVLGSATPAPTSDEPVSSPTPVVSAPTPPPTPVSTPDSSYTVLVKSPVLNIVNNALIQPVASAVQQVIQALPDLL